MISSRKELKSRAQQSMAFTKPSYLIAGIIMVIAVNAESWLSALLGKDEAFSYGSYEELMQQMDAVLDNLSIPLQLASLALGIFVAVLTFGFMRYCLRLSRGEKEVGMSELVSGFDNFWKVIGLNICTSILIVLWGLCSFAVVFGINFLVLGGIGDILYTLGCGIVAVFFALAISYRYRMAQYLLMDHPDWGIGKCISESKRMMKGHKMELFLLDLSFFGWIFLSSFCAMITFVPVMDIWLTPYMTVTECHFYNELAAQDAACRQSQGPGPSDADWWEN